MADETDAHLEHHDESEGPVAQNAPDADSLVVDEPTPPTHRRGDDAAEAAPSADDASADDKPDGRRGPTTRQRDGAPAEDTGPKTAVDLGLLPEVFVSAVSTQLVFYAPEIPELPPRPEPEQPAAEQASSTSARRRNRRRTGEGRDETSGPSEPQQPRQRAVELITEPQRIKGSTRLEAKKQRRRDGREAGRRRAVVTEAEFLARRESVDREMIVRSKNGRIQIAVLEDNVLVEHYVARNQDASLIGNVYLGRVQNVLPSMEAAFVDIGRGRNAVLYSGEVDWDAVETGNQPRRIELALKSGDRVLVQVTKDPSATRAHGSRARSPCRVATSSTCPVAR